MLVAVLVLLTVTVLTRLVVVVRTDRAVTPPRSHAHELDGAGRRLVW
jgi:hypothetical protein